MRTRCTRIFILLSVFVLVSVVVVSGQRSRSAQHSEQHNMRLIGYHDLQGRSAYQPVIQEQEGRAYGMAGH
jgi:hypothetical protein